MELQWSGTGNNRYVCDATGAQVGRVKLVATEAGPRWYAIVEPGHEATPPEGRLRFAEAANDLLIELLGEKEEGTGSAAG